MTALPSPPASPNLTRSDDPFGPVVTLALEAQTYRFRWVLPGTFTMGEARSRRRASYDQTAHTVTLSAGCWLGEAPVTQALWAALMGAATTNAGPAHPVVRVSWDESIDILARLNTVVPGLAARLPTEAVWERACRAGTDTETWVGRARFDALAPFAWSIENNDHVVQPVATRAPNPWGFHDLLGNVWEWCADWYGRYPTEAVIDPTGPLSGLSRIARGGMFLNEAKLLTAPRRIAFACDYRDEAVGVRLARAADDAPWDAPPAVQREPAPTLRKRAKARS